jgi:hypothetical protein
LSSDLLLAAGPKTESEPESSNREREKEKCCRKIIKEEGESFGENFLVFRFVFFSIFLGYKPWAREGELLLELKEKLREREKQTSCREKQRMGKKGRELRLCVCKTHCPCSLYIEDLKGEDHPSTISIYGQEPCRCSMADSKNQNRPISLSLTNKKFKFN